MTPSPVPALILLRREIGDGLDAVGLAIRHRHLVLGMNAFRDRARHLEFLHLGRRIGTRGLPRRRRLDGQLIIDAVEHRHGSRKRLVGGKGCRTQHGKRCGRDDGCEFHARSPVAGVNRGNEGRAANVPSDRLLKSA